MSGSEAAATDEETPLMKKVSSALAVKQEKVNHLPRSLSASAGTHHPSGVVGTSMSTADEYPEVKLASSSFVYNRRKSFGVDRNATFAAAATRFLYCIIYALVNVIISAPALYGYASVIFNNPVFSNHMNVLSKFVILSSLLMQLSFTLFSTMEYAIGTVQDAGLIFLSHMSNAIVDKMQQGNNDVDERAIVATTMVLLSASTALLGIVLIIIGKCKLGDVVSYLPMPVVGGYLAYIGYFCVQAGTALCISQAMISPSDWMYLFQGNNMAMATPGLLAGVVLVWVSRKANNDAYLPLTMVVIPIMFYAIVYATGTDLDVVREHGWLGQVSPPVHVSELFDLVDFRLVQWDCVSVIWSTWIGMVFVVSFASCLDVAAIAMDKGEALDTNKELATVGIGNLMSGLGFGYTGSYIFSQTIFTYRTGVHSRWIGILIMCVFFYIVISPVNFLQVVPLFFLGSALIFIGYDLCYEWLIEIRHRLLLSEYLIIWATFIAIQIFEVNAGIVLGVLLAVVDNIVTTAQGTSVRRVHKRSRAVRMASENKVLSSHAYSPAAPKIVVFEINGPVFFGSSLGILERLVVENGLSNSEELSIPEQARTSARMVRSPHTPPFNMLKNRDRNQSMLRDPNDDMPSKVPPQFVVLDLSQVTHMDASAARTCFFQFTTMCSKKGIVVCAAAAMPRMDWMLRSHDVSFKPEEEADAKRKIKSFHPSRKHPMFDCDRVLLFMTLHEALEFCEDSLIHLLAPLHSQECQLPVSSVLHSGSIQLTLSTAFARMLECNEEERRILHHLDGLIYHEERTLDAGEHIFSKGSLPSSFYVVLAGSVASIFADDISSRSKRKSILTGAGIFETGRDGTEKNSFGQIDSILPICSIFGYADFLIDRPRIFSSIAIQNGTRVARIDRSQLHQMSDDPALSALVHRVLLQASVRDLSLCTCRDV